MGRVNFNDAEENTSNFNTKFFKLGKGEVARVQFLLSSPEDIPTYYTHHLEVEGFNYGKDVQCNRSEYEHCDCELCKMGISRKTVCILPMYDLNTHEVKVWQRTKSWVQEKIIPLLNRYDLKETVVEIERQGEKLDTSYSLFAMLKDEPEDVSEVEVPDNFDFVLWKKSNEDMLIWKDTKEFSKVENNDEQEQITRRRSSDSDTRVRSRRG